MDLRLFCFRVTIHSIETYKVQNILMACLLIFPVDFVTFVTLTYQLYSLVPASNISSLTAEEE